MRRARKSINQINVVPYIDVMLVLLVIFMVTAPLVSPGEIELPSVGSKLVTPAQPFEVTLRSDQSLMLRDQAVANAPAVRITREELVARIVARQRSRSNRWSSPPTKARATKTCLASSTSCSATA
jgi:biopolymer transport protein TolR